MLPFFVNVSDKEGGFCPERPFWHTNCGGYVEHPAIPTAEVRQNAAKGELHEVFENGKFVVLVGAFC